VHEDQYRLSEPATVDPFASNRFDLIRLLLAAGVFAFDAIALGEVSPFGPLERGLALVAEMSVQGFFIVSGALVAGSLARASSLADYAGKRLRRLWPAYAVIILIPAAISFALTQDRGGALSYVLANLSFLNFLEPGLPGLFEENRFTEVNGALWTLKIEVMFYLVLPLILFVLTRLRGLWWLGILVLYAFGETWAAVLPRALEGSLGLELARQLPGQLAYFAVGIALWRLEPVLRRRWLTCAVLGALLLGASLTDPVLAPLRALGLAGVIAGAAFAPGPALSPARFGDISYGVYITHFPILQAMVAAGLTSKLGAAGFIGAGALVVIAASLALWHLVEKPALRPSSHYRLAASEAKR